VLVRRAVPADAEGVAAVHVASWPGTYRGVFPTRFSTGRTWPRTACGPPGSPTSRCGSWRATPVPGGSTSWLAGFRTARRRTTTWPGRRSARSATAANS